MKKSKNVAFSPKVAFLAKKTGGRWSNSKSNLFHPKYVILFYSKNNLNRTFCNYILNPIIELYTNNQNSFEQLSKNTISQFV